MDLNSMSEKSGKSRAVLDAARHKSNEAAEQERRAARTREKVKEIEAPVTDYARALLNFTENLEPGYRTGRYEGHPSVSRLVNVGQADGENCYFVQVQKEHHWEDYDWDGNPRSEVYDGMSFQISVGTEMTDQEYWRIPEKERREISCVGTTIAGKKIYGNRIASEGNFGSPRLPGWDGAEVKAAEKVEKAMETVTLMQKGLADETLNPRPWGLKEIPKSLLPED